MVESVGVEGAEALAGGLHSGSFTPVDDERSAEGCTRQGSELGAPGSLTAFSPLRARLG